MAEIVPSNLDDADIELAIASVHLTADGEMTWAQVAMKNGHPGAVAKALVAILDAQVDLDLQHTLVRALRVDPVDVSAALKDPQWSRGPWAVRLARRIEQRFPSQLSSPEHTKGTSVSQH